MVYRWGNFYYYW